MTYLGNSTSISGNWVNDKFIGECLGQLVQDAKEPKGIVFNYDKSGKYSATKAPSTYFVNKDATKCPVTQCVVRDSTCQKPLENVSAAKVSPFSLTAINNLSKGYTQDICLTCSNKHDSASVQLTLTQQNCATTKNCPDCTGQLTKTPITKDLTFKYIQSNTPVVAETTAPQLFVNKDVSQCPITKCELMDNDCDEPFVGGYITLDKANKINVITDFVDGWTQQVCVVCANDAGKV